MTKHAIRAVQSLPKNWMVKNKEWSIIYVTRMDSTGPERYLDGCNSQLIDHLLFGPSYEWFGALNNGPTCMEL